MMSSVAVIGDLDTVTGFRLGGVREGRIVNTKEEAEQALDELIENNFSIIIITDKIADEIREHIRKTLGSDIVPMIIEIPDKNGKSETDGDQMRALIKRVIGVDIK
ncbi:V-type ATP synthase subunit F [Methanobrevibacter boviskoreani]|uniref:V-type ATP synthase subunit F n=1 Tax=Methanobrevibacter boviskoreani TaxID=1348249 RepID=UPI0023A8AE05|nr:V-type ATP synthase subunit F [Methanobrevibacter boviskoreani]MCI6775080.1 V-type ATP synthase subunit F [Methanobrevibacter boviskoreani]MCI6930350.1 V-type ATP synthase subunit F [Methanobrevibacter boviskoreani]MDD6256538.1 V-type ATP synthase subunit F [Methanobrevibacter boviskoreani]MDY5614470.1 V-type ATP synthase subunit F [Methanobrevibacter boviskoreani]